MAIEIGQKVRIRGIRQKVPTAIINQLKQSPYGVVKGYRMVDGSDVGFVVELDDNLSTWFFEDELEASE
ncbi:MAG: DUF2862 domain-containing protein [Microcoleaceae cyanobacterium]